jgi:hypothetical protein
MFTKFNWMFLPAAVPLASISKTYSGVDIIVQVTELLLGLFRLWRAMQMEGESRNTRALLT